MSILSALRGRIVLAGSLLACFLATSVVHAQSSQYGGNITGHMCTSQADFDAAAQWIKNKGFKEVRVHFNYSAPSSRKDWARKAASDKGLKLIVTTGWIIPVGGSSGVQTAGNSDPKALEAAVNLWLNSTYSPWLKANPSVILNIANEWGPADQNAHTSWRDEYTKAIKRLREAGITNPLMIDADGYGQGPKSIRAYGKTLRDLSWSKNGKSYKTGTLHYSIHIYPDYWYDKAYCDSKTPRLGYKAYDIKTEIKAMETDSGTPVEVGEYGRRGKPESDVRFDIATVRAVAKSGGAAMLCSWYENY